MIRCAWVVLGLSVSQQAIGEDTTPVVPQGRVERAQFTSGINDREPVDRLAVVSPPVSDIYFFSELRNLQGRTVTHRWEYRGQVVSRVRFEVEGPRWRVFSKKVLAPDEVGEWSVTVVDESGWPLGVELLRYEEAPAAPPVAPQDIPLSE